MSIKTISSQPDNVPDYKLLYQELQSQHQFMLSQISHEIRNPVTLINSFLQLLESHHPELSSERYWKKIMENMEFLRELLEEFSTFNNSGRLCTQKLHLEQLFCDIVTSVSPTCESLGITVELQTHGTVPAVLADKTKIRQLILNLLRNAREAIGTHGKIICSLQEQDNMVLISIKDTGPGIPDDYQKDVFEPFITHKQEGTGLGLAICKRIAQAHNGSISFTSSPHKGTEFTILLPSA